MAKNSKQKGNRVERLLCKELRKLGYEARRSQQYQGVVSDDDSADIQHNIPGIRIECKGGYNDEEPWRKVVQEWIETAKAETPSDQEWMIFWKRDYKEWEVIFEIEGIVVRTDDLEGAISYTTHQTNLRKAA